jgi:hypothetical protein
VRSRLGGQLLQEESAAFHQSLCKVFKEGKELLVSELTNDGSMFCLLELLASHQATPSSFLLFNFAFVADRQDFLSIERREI